MRKFLLWTLVLFPLPAWALPIDGIQYQTLRTVELTGGEGAFQLTVLPNLKGEKFFDLIDFHLRAPIPVLDNPGGWPLKVRAVAGFHQQNSNWATFVRGLDYGFQAHWTPIQLLGVHAQATNSTLLGGASGSQGFAVLGRSLPRLEAGLSFHLPANVTLIAGYQAWSYYGPLLGESEAMAWQHGPVLGFNWQVPTQPQSDYY